VPLQVARLVAGSFALVAFALAIAVGLSAGNPADAIITRALFALVVATVAGYPVGLVLEHLVRVASRRIDARADARIAEEEAILEAAFHAAHAPAQAPAHAPTQNATQNQSNASAPSAPTTPATQRAAGRGSTAVAPS
jgi:uncharacterized membrane protein YraQ (UPF0718 family)